jgi:hypothetical protein
MVIRNGIYTYSNGIEMALQEYYGHGLPPSIENHRMISYPKELGLMDGFKLNPEANIYFKDIKVNEIQNAFRVTTKTTYKGHSFQIFGFNEEKQVTCLLTRDRNLAKTLDFIDVSDGHVKDVNLNELDSIWEERETSEYDLPFPKDLETITILK